MRRDNLHIPEPCSADWDQMNGPQQRRFCDLCEKHVHNLSEMTRREAERLLRPDPAANSPRLCVRYRYDKQGRVRFASRAITPSAPAPQRHGARRLLAGAAMITSMLTAPLLAHADHADHADPSVEQRVLSQERLAAEHLRAFGLDLEEEVFEVAQSNEDDEPVEMGEAPLVDTLPPPPDETEVIAGGLEAPPAIHGDGDGDGDGDSDNGTTSNTPTPHPDEIEMGEPVYEPELMGDVDPSWDDNQL